MSESVAGGTAYKTRRNDIKSGAGFIHSTHGVLDVRAHGFDSRSFFIQELFVYARGAGDARVVERAAAGGRFGVYLGGVAFHELGEPHRVGADSRRRGVRLDTAVIRRVCHKTTCCSPSSSRSLSYISGYAERRAHVTSIINLSDKPRAFSHLFVLQPTTSKPALRTRPVVDP